MKYHMYSNKIDRSSSKRGRKSHEQILRDIDQETFERKMANAESWFNLFGGETRKVYDGNVVNYHIDLGGKSEMNFSFMKEEEK